MCALDKDPQRLTSRGRDSSKRVAIRNGLGIVIATTSTRNCRDDIRMDIRRRLGVKKPLRAGAMSSRNTMHVPVGYQLVHRHKNTDIPSKYPSDCIRFYGISFAFLANVAWIRGKNRIWFFFPFFLQNIFEMLQAFGGAERIPAIQFLKNIFGNDFVLKI